MLSSNWSAFFSHLRRNCSFLDLCTNQHTFASGCFFFALVCDNAHSKGEYKELLSLDSVPKSVKIQIVSSEVWAFQLYPVHAVCFCWSIRGICYRSKRRCYVSRKDDRSRGNSLPAMVLAALRSSINSLQAGVAQTCQSRAWSSPSHITLMIWLSSRIQKGLFLLKLPLPERIEERYWGDFSKLEGEKRGSLSVRKVTKLPASCRKQWIKENDYREKMKFCFSSCHLQVSCWNLWESQKASALLNLSLFTSQILL